jgi:sugar O-acyltransferase (sialic acid O-acetyltransferase NeuD family)
LKNKIIIVGGGGHAKVLISILKKILLFEIVGYTDTKDNGVILGVPYLGNDEVLQSHFDCGVKMLAIGIGQIKSSSLRKSIVNKLKTIGFEFPTIISPNSIVNEDIQIGEGTVIMDGVVINSGTIIANYSIVNTNSSIDHDCKIGSYTHIAPGVTLSGEVTIGDNVLIGTGASVIQQISIMDNCIISAGSSVQKSIMFSGIYRGVPAKMIKEIV